MDGVVYVIVGERDVAHFHTSLRLLRHFKPDLPVVVYHDIPKERLGIMSHDVEFKKYTRISYPHREENRNSSLWRLMALKKSTFDTTLYIDNDVYVVHEGFFEGFKIAEHYGICMVQNERAFIKTFEGDMGDADIGEDVLDYDKQFINEMPSYMTAMNMGVIFNHFSKWSWFLDAMIEEQKDHPSRGQAGLYRTIWKTKKMPYCLPMNWLACGAVADIKRPLSLHVGHVPAMERFNQEFRGKLL